MNVAGVQSYQNSRNSQVKFGARKVSVYRDRVPVVVARQFKSTLKTIGTANTNIVCRLGKRATELTITHGDRQKHVLLHGHRNTLGCAVNTARNAFAEIATA